MKLNKSGQEELIGFALIMIIVAVVMLIFLSLSLASPNKKTVESYEVESFLSSALSYTTGCETYGRGLRDLEDLVRDCNGGLTCTNGDKACDVLENTFTEILNVSWRVGPNWPYNGYTLKIYNEEETEILTVKEGNETGDSRGYTSLDGRGNEISLTIYAKP